MNAEYPESFYRVSVKAIIRNSKGEFLAVKEKGEKWSLPGGGMDHGELPVDCLARELYEELHISDTFTADLIAIDSYYYEPKAAWVLWVLYEVTFEGDFMYEATDDVGGVSYMSPESFKDGDYPYQQLIYKWATK